MDDLSANERDELGKLIERMKQSVAARGGRR